MLKKNDIVEEHCTCSW